VLPGRQELPEQHPTQLPPWMQLHEPLTQLRPDAQTVHCPPPVPQ
jgi:hypothetical protein